MHHKNLFLGRSMKVHELGFKPISTKKNVYEHKIELEFNSSGAQYIPVNMLVKYWLFNGRLHIKKKFYFYLLSDHFNGSFIL